MPIDIQYLTKEKIKELNDELDFLRTTRRKEVAESLEYAKKLGDLSENAEYNEAREEQAKIEDRIMHLESILKNAQIVSGEHGEAIGIGSRVRIKKDNEKDTREYFIVGSEEADMANNKISNLSPLGMSVIGKKKGDNIKVQTPKGLVGYSIVEVL